MYNLKKNMTDVNECQTQMHRMQTSFGSSYFPCFYGDFFFQTVRRIQYDWHISCHAAAQMTQLQNHCILCSFWSRSIWMQLIWKFCDYEISQSVSKTINIYSSNAVEHMFHSILDSTPIDSCAHLFTRTTAKKLNQVT